MVAGRQVKAVCAGLPAALCFPAEAFAHASDRGHVLLLPTGYYVVGGAFAVAISFLVIALVPYSFFEHLWRRRRSLFGVPDGVRIAVSLISFAGFAILIAAGLFGSRDPLSNPLPLVIWTVLWVGLTLLQGLLGNVWSFMNPWYGPWRLARAVTSKSGISKGRHAFEIDCWPAVVLLFAFSWFELIDPAPDDPARLAVAAGLYWLATFTAMLLMGYDRWCRQGEFLSLFFTILSRFSIFGRGDDGRLCLRWPGSGLMTATPLPPGGIAFILLALSSVSFDGLSRTFFWLSLVGINPLEFPGRTAVIGSGTLGLILAFVALTGLFLAAVLLGQSLSGLRHRAVETAGLLVWSIVPIALAYHAAHYLTALMLDGQYAIAALSDPFALGWNLFGTADMEVRVGLVSGAESAWWLWNWQAGFIIAGHVLAVIVAHGFSGKIEPDPRRAMLLQLPLTVMMIAYTVFGLWLLATPTAG